MFPQDQELSNRCRQVYEAARGGIQWLVDNGPDLKQDVQGLVKELRKSAVEARKLEAAALRKMCVGIFGQSQMGKSYLVSALARRDGRPLLANFAGDTVDFLAKINPTGGKESTGLVTRFTIDRPSGLPAGHPVQLRLLSEPDVVKILANSYVNDLEFREQTEESHDAGAIMQALQGLERRAGGAAQPGFTEDDVADIEDYCARKLIAHPRIKVMKHKTNFWDIAGRIAPRLNAQDRVALFSLIWSDIQPLTQLYSRLRKVLESLEFSADAFASYDSLADRQHSIIDVETLNNLGQDSGDTVSVTTASGRGARIQRNELAAITAELRIVMDETPFDFFEHTDLLDFPGARSRPKISNLGDFLADGAKGGMKNFFMRGKVAYLFERYTEEQELTSLLLCMDNTNPEVVELPDLVSDWINRAAGQSPEERANRPNPLILVLTKYDNELIKASGAVGADPSIFEARFHNFLNFFGKNHSWPREWKPGRAFNSTLLMRNPAYPQDALFDYVKDAQSGKLVQPPQETGLLSHKVTLMNEAQAVFSGCPLILDHVSDTRAVWEALIHANDGGMSLLVQMLRPLCNPQVKRDQVSDRLASQTNILRLRLKPFYFSGDVEELLSQKRAMAERIRKRISRVFRDQRFGHLLTAMQVNEEELYSLYLIVERLPAGGGAGASPQEAASLSAPPPIDDLDEEEDPLAASVSVSAPPQQPRDDGTDLPAAFARAVLLHWTERLQQLPTEVNLLLYLRVTDEDMINMVGEIILAAGRTGLRQRMVERVRQLANFRNMDKESLIWKQASALAMLINEFVANLAFGGIFVDQGSTVSLSGKDFPLFRRREQPQVFPILPPSPLPHDRESMLEWAVAFSRTAEDNVQYQIGTAINVEQNGRLGEILSQVDGRAVTAA